LLPSLHLYYFLHVFGPIYLLLIVNLTPHDHNISSETTVFHIKPILIRTTYYTLYYRSSFSLFFLIWNNFYYIFNIAIWNIAYLRHNIHMNLFIFPNFVKTFVVIPDTCAAYLLTYLYLLAGSKVYYMILFFLLHKFPNID